MDLAAGARNLLVMTEHCTKTEEPKLVRRCSYPLTGVGVVKRVYTDLAVLEVDPCGFVVLESLAAISREELQARTDATLHWSISWRPLDVPALGRTTASKRVPTRMGAS